MKDKRPSTAIFIDKWHPRQDGTCAITIRVTYNRQKRYYPTEHTLTLSDFEKVQAGKSRGELKKIATSLNAYENRAAEIIEALHVFTFEAFERRYFTNIGADSPLSYLFENKIRDCREAARIGTAITYECANVSLGKFKPKATIASVNPSFLEQYEQWMLKQGNSKTTIGIYLRSLRSLFNDAIADGILSQELYPFGKRKYQIPSSKNTKKALNLQEVGLIYNYKAAPGSSEEMARDYWLFLYLCNGMNVKDMALLKRKHLKDGVLSFERSKTTRTKREAEAIRIILSDEAIAIINKWGNENKGTEAYIFPILEAGLSPEREKELIGLKVHVINENMKAIAAKIGINKNVTTYFARHSFATILQRSGASIEFISDALGHGNTKTTQSYLAGFEDDHKKEITKALTAFKK